MNNFSRNIDLKNFIAELIAADVDFFDLTDKDKLKIISLYQPDCVNNCDTMCTDFDEDHALCIISLLNGDIDEKSRSFLIDSMYSNIRSEVEEIFDQESALKIEAYNDHFDKCLSA